MPEYAPLTQQEKDAIIARHHFIVDELNKTLDNALKYEDEAILQKMEDPEQVALYRLYEQNVRDKEKRDQIMASLETKYGKSKLRENPMSRTIRFCFRPSDDPKDVAYNEQLYKDFINEPEKVVYREYSNVLKLNPQDLYDIGEDKVKAAEYYLRNTSLCQGAFAIQSVLDKDENSKALRDALKPMKASVETLTQFPNIVKQSGIDSFACPTLTFEQTAMAMGSPIFNNHQNEELNEILNQRLGASVLETPHSYFQKFIDKGININDPDFLVKYKPVRTNPETGAQEKATFKDFLDGKANVTLQERTKDEMFQIRTINRSVQARYAIEFQYRIAARLKEATFDANRIADERKGGWIERKIRNSTSPEWTSFIEAFKQYNDPEHPNYLRKDILKPKAEAYLQHKRDQGYESLEDMKGTALKRGTLCQAVIDTCEELDAQEDIIKAGIDNEINRAYQGKVSAIVNAKEVDIHDDLGEHKDEPQVQAQQDLDKDAPEVDEGGIQLS